MLLEGVWCNGQHYLLGQKVPVRVRMHFKKNLNRIIKMEAQNSTAMGGGLSPMKKCSKCGRVLTLDNFHKQPTSKDGLSNKCRDCRNEEAKIYNRRKRVKEGQRNPSLEGFTARELLDELFARGYRGNLTFEEVKVHKIVLG